MAAFRYMLFNKRPKNVKLRSRHVALFDCHIPHNINLNPVLDFISYYRPTHLILGGDFLNLEWASHWNSDDFPILGYSKISSWLSEELEIGRQTLAAIRKKAPADCAIYYVPGNHEDWLRMLVTKFPQLLSRSILDADRITYRTDLAYFRKMFLSDILNELLELESFKIQVTTLDEPLALDRIYYMHGHSARGQNPAKSMVEKNKKTTVFGHFHQAQIYTSTSPISSDEVHQGISVPCLCNLKPGYSKSHNNSWTNGFFAADIYSDFFVPHIIPIMQGQVQLLGGQSF